ncbi:hypothetical protein K466DRAFT_408129 [Polyporus arcularius HHB13444]|uniref:Uncharacterized protein n=1 Tax=Polyporus arcularius HHB13444 TaxID=1314778 RepID=A0A5C3NR91_9APHY|nr:hypothetical protein K466DRAFT_408129 [Polyporus arcularius HHB13444]
MPSHARSKTGSMERTYSRYLGDVASPRRSRPDKRTGTSYRAQHHEERRSTYRCMRRTRGLVYRSGERREAGSDRLTERSALHRAGRREGYSQNGVCKLAFVADLAA